MLVSDLRIKKFKKKIGKVGKVEFKKVVFDESVLNIDNDLDEVIFDRCIFFNGIKITNVSCRTLIFTNCSFGSRLGIKLEKVNAFEFHVGNCRFLENTDDNYTFTFGSGIYSDVVAISSCKFGVLNITNTELGLDIVDSTVQKKVSITSLKKEKSLPYKLGKSYITRLGTSVPLGQLTYEQLKCLEALSQSEKITRSDKFDSRIEYVSVKDTKIGGEFIISDSNIGRLDFHSVKRTKETNGAMFSFETSYFTDINFEKFICEDVYLSFENVIFNNLKALNSKLGKNLNCYISSKCEDEEKRVNSIEIKQCEITKSNFNNRLVDNPLNFTETVFKNAPSFFNTEIPLESIFPSKNNFHVDGSQESVLRYKLLRKHMEDIRDREREGDFFYLEQECLLKRKGVPGKFVRQVYSLASSYGTSAFKPIMWLFLTFITFTICYALIVSPKIHCSLPIDWNLLRKSFHFSLKQTLIPFWSLRDFTPLYDKNTTSSWLILPAVFQSALSTAFIALSILSIRWRFKRG